MVRAIRQLTDVPVIMLTALKSDKEIIQALDVGVDDFIGKPFNSPVLLAKARAVLRYTKQPPEKVLTRGFQDSYLQIDLEKRRVLIQGEAVILTPTEYRLLTYLVGNVAHVRAFKQILENVWGWKYREKPDYVHVYMSHLRQKFKPDPREPRYILTDHGLGYHFEK